MLATVLKWFGIDAFAFRRVDFPGFTVDEMPKRFVDIDRMPSALREKQRRNKQIRREAKRRGVPPDYK